MARVLIIEDDLDIRQVVAYVLSDEGYDVDEAADGQAGLELIERRRPDVILLDMKMPGMDGWEFARLYRERHGHDAPIIVITAATDAEQRGVDVAADSFVAKPFDLTVLVERVAAAVRAHA
jgi:DNA-binding response OmpR family regulator